MILTKMFDIFKKNTKAAKVRALENHIENTSFDSGAVTDRELFLQNQITELKNRMGDIDSGIDEITGNDYRTMTIQDWINAVRQADQPYSRGYMSSWVELFDIYANMMLDPQVQGAIETINEGVASNDFYLANEDGSKNEDLTKIFKSKWLYDFFEEVVNVKLWGFGLVQLYDYDPATLSVKVKDINRKHVRPDLDGLVKQQYDQNVWRDWNVSPYKDWTIYLFDKKLGKLNSCVRWWIYKIEIARLWAKYNQLFGIPPVVAKTAVKDSARKNNAITMLKNFVRSRWMVIDEKDELEQFNSGSSNGTGHTFFENLIRLADEQISKGLLSSTMVMDNGSSRSQSETHAENTGNIIKSISRLALFSINQELIPRLKTIGMPIPDGVHFVWDKSEKLTMKERAEVVTTLVNSGKYMIPADTVSEFVGIEVIEMDEPDNDFDKKEFENYKNTFLNVRAKK